VVEITSPIAFDPNGTALPGGLYDPRLGSQDYHSHCITCAMHSKDCAGHSGHITLKQPVYHPLLVLEILSILRTKCWNCHRTRAPRSKVRVAAAKFVLLFQNNQQSLNDYHNLDGKIATAIDAAVQGGDDGENAKDAAMDSVIHEILHNVTSRTPHLPTSYHAVQYTLLRNQTLNYLRATNRCHHCGVYSPRLRQDGGNKIFRSPLSKKYQSLNAKEGLAKFRSALDEKNAYDSDDTGQGMSDDEDNDDDDDDDEKIVSKRDIYVSALEVEAHLKHYWTKEPLITSILFGDRLKYILHVIPVPPVRFRPFMKLGGGMAKAEHAQSAALSAVMKVNETMEGNKAAIELQKFVNNFMDSSHDATAASGIRQLLEKKSGLFRQNMMGKRVNFACRSVISPDLYVGSNEIGLPVHFCQVLTFPEAVNERNLGAMRSLVERGPANYPGARWVQLSFSSSSSDSNSGHTNVIDLTKMNEGRRHAVSAQLATGSVVGRQLRDGDYVLMNRQVRRIDG
jgi:DNA-directed RNA polymerase I subunit RPA1